MRDVGDGSKNRDEKKGEKTKHPINQSFVKRQNSFVEKTEVHCIQQRKQT